MTIPRLLTIAGAGLLAAGLVLVQTAQADEERFAPPLAAAGSSLGGFGSGLTLGQAIATGTPAPRVSDNDAGIVVNSAYVPDDQSGEAYGARNDDGSLVVPGMAGVADLVLRRQLTQSARGQSDGGDYSLAHAMADALWRKKVVQSLYGHIAARDE